MKTIADLKIASKISTLLCGLFVLFLCMGLIVVWGSHSFRKVTDELSQQQRLMLLAQRVSGDVDGVLVRVANAVINGKSTAADDDRVAGLRKEYLDSIEELRALSTNGEAKQQLASVEAAIASAREADTKVLTLQKSGKQREAGAAFQLAVPLIGQMETAAQHYVKMRQADLERMRNARGVELLKIGYVMALFCIGSLLAGVLAGAVLTQSITRPLQAAIRQLDQVTKGDISFNIPLEHLDRDDEMGVMSRAMRTMCTTLRGMIAQIGDGSAVLSSSSGELTGNSERMSSGLRTASDRAHSVPAAAEPMSVNMNSVAEGMGQTSGNRTSVASSTEQMSSTINEIASNSEKARRMSGNATQQATGVAEQMNLLRERAWEIGKLIETIDEISSQTQLLALNATVEASRAGSMGKGFGVVATEIKELASKTAVATADIRARIESVQVSSANGIAGVEKISQVVVDVGDIVASIAAAIDEQATVTRNIAQDIARASTSSVLESSERVSQPAPMSH